MTKKTGAKAPTFEELATLATTSALTWEAWSTRHAQTSAMVAYAHSLAAQFDACSAILRRMSELTPRKDTVPPSPKLFNPPQ